MEKLKNAIKEDSQLFDDITLLLASWNRSNRQNYLMVTATSEVGIDINKLTLSTLEIINQLTINDLINY